MNSAAFQIARICVVIALVCIAAAIVTPKGRLPLALRGLAKMLARDRGQARSTAVDGYRVQSVSAGKRALAFTLVILAILIALI